MKKTKKKIMHRIGMGLVFGAICGGLGYGGFKGYQALTAVTADAKPLTLTLQPQSFALVIPAKGELQSVESTLITTPPVPVDSPLRIATLVPEGSRVKKGDVLIEFDPTELTGQALEHRSSLDAANLKINKGEMTSGAEKTDIGKDRSVAELELKTIQEFQPKNEEIFTRRQILEGELDRNFTEKKIMFADVRLQLKGKVYTLEEAILVLEREKAKAKIGQVERALGSLKLLAPTSGIVVYPQDSWSGVLQPGKTVFLGMPLFSLVQAENMEAKCYVLEKDAGDLKPNLPVTVTLDPYPGVEFAGKVKGIDKLARPLDRESPVKFFQVIVALDQTDQQRMKPGVKVTAKIRAGDVPNALLVPRSAVVKKESGFVAYLEKQSGQFEAVPVTLGQGDAIQVVLTKGVQPGQTIALNPPDAKRDKQKG
ncbi:MAG: HlyD family efflux transporter periplasmic adaptor subunit [Blastocatellia bacterium]|nr:HlyD family efflux transporter periplasmic adaptor subunit [Blastocatellia bacterium]